MVRMVKNERSYIERSWTMRGLILKRGSWGEAGKPEAQRVILRLVPGDVFSEIKSQNVKPWIQTRPGYADPYSNSAVCFVAIQSVRFSFWDIFQNYFTLFTFCKFFFRYTFMLSIFTFCKQGCIFRLTCSHPELTDDHVLTSAYVKIFRTVMRNAVNKSVWSKKDCSWPPLNKYAINIWLSSLRIRAHLSWRTGKHLHVLHVLRTYSTCSYPGY